MRRLADLQERSRDRKEPRERRSSEPEHAVEPEHDVERRLGALHKRLSKTSPALARELEFPVDERAKFTAPGPQGDFRAAVAKVDAAMDVLVNAIEQLNAATGMLIKAADATPHKRAAYVFANLADNLGGSIGELDELLGPMKAAPALEFPVDERTAAGGLPAGMGAVRNGFEQFSTALMNLENAIGQAWKGIDRTPASRVMMDFAAPLDNISTNIEPEMRDNLVKLELAVRQLGRP